MTNQGPYNPGGGDWLVYPNPGDNVSADTAFFWKKLTDLDGDAITYQLWVCMNGDFSKCSPVNVNVPSARHLFRLAGGFGALGAGLLAFGFGFTRGGRRMMMLLLASLALAGAVTLAACGSGSSGSGSSTIRACSSATAAEACRDQLTLSPGSYQWKVVADDGRGGTAESGIRSLTVR